MTTMTILLRLDATGRIVAAQPAGSVPVGHSVLDLAPPTERQRIDGLLARARGGEPAWGDATLALDGQERRYRLAIVPGELGTSAWLLSPLSGTDGIPWEDERELERWLGAFLVEQVEIGALVFDAIGTLRYRNRTAVRLLGADQLPVGSALATVAGQLADCCAQGEPIAVLLREAFAEGRPLRQVELERHDGIVLELDFVPVHDEGRLTAGVLRLRDITARRRSERRAAAAEARYRELVELLPVVVYRAPADAIAETSYVSPQIERLLGYSAEEWLAVPGMWARHLYPDDRARVVAAIEQAIADGREFSLEYRMVRRDGSIVWVQDWGRLQIDERGGRFVHGVMLDITERKLAEQARAEAEERLAALVEAIPAIIYVVDATPTLAPDGTPTYPIRYVNEHFETLTGYPVSALYERPALYAELIHPDDRARYAREALRTDETGELFDLEYRLIRRDGAVLWVRERAVLLRDQDGRPVAWQGLTIDITAQKQAELALREAEERFRLLAEHHPGAVTIVEPEPVALPDGTYGWRTIYASPRIVDFTGYTAVEWSELGVWMRGIHPDDRERVLEEAKRWYTEGPAGPLEYRFRRKDGRLVWLRQDGALVRDRDGRPRYLYLITLDITAERELLEQVRLAEERYRTLVEQLPGAVLIRPLLPDEAAFRTAPPNPYVSPAIERLTGFTAEEWTNDRFLAQLHPEDRERVLATVFESDRTGAPISIEYRLLRKDGSVVWVWSVSHVIRAADGTPLYRQVLLTDISERKQAELALREAEERYRALVEQLPGAVILRSHTSRVLPDGELSYNFYYVSPNIEHLTGFTPEEWREPGRWSSRLHPDDRERVLAAIRESERTGSPLDLEYRFLRKDGRTIWIWHITWVLHDAEGRPAQRQVLLLNVTKRKESELALREAEERYRTLVEQLPGAVIVRSGLASEPGGRLRIHYVSPSIERLTGFTPEEWREPGRWSGQLHPDDRERVLAAMHESERTGAPLDLEYRYVRKDGRVVWLWHLARVIHDAEGRPAQRQVLLMDITERKQAELALREAEARYRALVEQLPGAVLIRTASSELQPDGTRRYTFHYVSPGIEQLTGFTPDEWLVPGTWTRQMHPEDRERVLAAILASEAAGAPLDIEYRLFRKDGSLVWIWHRTEIIRDAEGRPLYRQVLLTDITARKEAEEALRAAEAHYRTLVEQLPAAVVRVAAYAERLPDGVPGYETSYVSPQIEDITGFTPEEWKRPGIWARQLHPEDRERVLQEVWRHEPTGEPLRLEYRFQRKDGETVWLWHEVRAIRSPDGTIGGRQAILMDITERKRIEEALRAAEERFRTLVEQIPAALVILEPRAEWLPDGLPGYRTHYASPRILDLTGYAPEEWEQLGVLARSTHPDDRPALLEFLGHVERTGEPGRLEYRFVRKDGQLAWHRLEIWPIRTPDGSVLQWHALMLDVTREKEAERALREAEERYRNLVEQLPAVVYVEGVAPVRYPNGRLDRPLVYVSPQIEQLTGHTPEEHQRDRTLWIRAIHPDDYQRVRRETREAWATERFHSEFRIVHADGSVRWLESTARLVRDADGKPLYWQGVMLDVTERKRIEEELQEAEERYLTLVEQIPAAVIVTSATPVVLPDGTLHYPVTYLSPRIEEVTGFSREEFEATPGLWFSRMHPDDQPRVFAEAVRTDETGESFQVTYRFQRKDGRWVWLENRAVMMRDAHGHPLFWHGLLIDVTERKRTEELLVAQTTLLRLIAEAAPLSEVLERLCRLVEAQAPGLLCSVLLLDSEGRLRHAAAPSLPPEAIATIDGVRIGPEVGSCGTAAYLNQPVYVADTRTDPRWARYRGLAERFGFRACWSTPIRDATGTVLGTVALYATEPRAPRPEEERLLELATQLAALALERWRESEELRHRAFHDPLTGLPNRLLFLDRLEHAIARAERDGGLAVLFVDLDDFKRINDTWGHGAGDLVLQEVARRLARSVRASDTVARFAGDEFTVLLEGVSDPNEVRGVAERLIAALAEPIDFEVAAARVSLSVGAAFGVGSPLPDSGTLLLAADQALYAAKRRGKCCAELVVLGRTARSTEPADAP